MLYIRNFILLGPNRDYNAVIKSIKSHQSSRKICMGTFYHIIIDRPQIICKAINIARRTTRALQVIANSHKRSKEC